MNEQSIVAAPDQPGTGVAPGALLVLRAETPLHAGAGTGAGEIDLPVQREAVTAWPVIFASSVKGALRERAEQWAGSDKARSAQVEAVFGKEGRGAVEHASALATGEAALLLLPVRSLTTHFKWVTCDAAIRRLVRTCARIGVRCAAAAPALQTPDTACWDSGAGDLFLEEFAFQPGNNASIGQLAKAIAMISGIDEQELLTRLVVVHDDRFRWFAEHATPKAAHIALDNDTKTNTGGALWYEETLAPDTVLYAPLAAEATREKRDKGMSPMLTASKVLAVATDRFAERPYLRVGGNETLGMGWCHVHVAAAGAP
jgi:CRISPR-associated protein Cmr4